MKISYFQRNRLLTPASRTHHLIYSGSDNQGRTVHGIYLYIRYAILQVEHCGVLLQCILVEHPGITLRSNLAMQQCYLGCHDILQPHATLGTIYTDHNAKDNANNMNLIFLGIDLATRHGISD